MAKEKPKDILEEDSSKATSEQKSTDKAQKALSEREAFAGDEKFYDFMARLGKATAGWSDKARKLSQVRSLLQHFSILQKALALGIIVTALMLVYALIKPSSMGAANRRTVPITRQVIPPESPTTGYKAQVRLQQIQESQSVSDSTQPLSLKVAHDYYLQKDYVMAYEVYNQLQQNLPATDESNLLRHFLLLKKALCIRKTGDLDRAGRLLKDVSRSRSPIIRILANYYLSFIEVQKEQYLKARTRAYKTIALISAVDMDGDLALLLQRDCHITIAESVTRQVLLLCDIDEDIPRQLWSRPAELNPFSGINEMPALSELLDSGSEQLSRGLLSPQIQEITYPGAPIRWSVVCHGASIEELLARFAANAELDITWELGNEEGAERVKRGIRNRSVSLYLPAATTQQSVTTAAGCVGLLARLDEQGSVSIFNPDEYGSLSEFISLLSHEAVSLWQSFLLSFYDDQHVPNAHFALGLLRAQRGPITESIAEFKLVANRYSQTPLASFALLHSSKLKAGLRDHPGAQQDLKQLVEQYPDSELSGRACLYLADATMKAGFLIEATRLYSKVYNLGLSRQSQAKAAFGAARCCYETEDYKTAAKWLIRYIKLVKDRTDRELYLAYFLFGKVNLNLGNLQQACNAFQYALTGDLSREKYIETVSELVEAQIKQGHFIKALTLIDGVHPWQFTQKEFIEILLTKSKVLRTMGLVDNAISVLGDRAEYVPDPHLKARLNFELSKCYIAKDNLKLARRDLTEILVLIEPGPLANEISLVLADVCLKLGENSQAVQVCSELLDSDPSEQIKQSALNILAEAYKRQKDYDKATLILLGRWEGDEPENKKTTFDSPDDSSQLLKHAREK